MNQTEETQKINTTTTQSLRFTLGADLLWTVVLSYSPRTKFHIWVLCQIMLDRKNLGGCNSNQLISHF